MESSGDGRPFLCALSLGTGLWHMALPSSPEDLSTSQEYCTRLGFPRPNWRLGRPYRSSLVGGLAVLAGAFVPLASVPMSLVLLVAAFTVHLPYGCSSIKLQDVISAGARFGAPGYEVDLLYLACLASLALGGSGPLTVERYLATRKRKRRSNLDGNRKPFS